MVKNSEKTMVQITFFVILAMLHLSSGEARGRGGKWEHAPWGAGLGGVSAHFL